MFGLLCQTRYSFLCLKSCPFFFLTASASVEKLILAHSYKPGSWLKKIQYIIHFNIMGGWTQTSHEYGWLRTSFQIWMNGTAHFFLFAQCYSTQSYTVLKPTSRGQWWMHTLSCLSLRFFIFEAISLYEVLCFLPSQKSAHAYEISACQRNTDYKESTDQM